LVLVNLYYLGEPEFHFLIFGEFIRVVRMDGKEIIFNKNVFVDTKRLAARFEFCMFCCDTSSVMADVRHPRWTGRAVV
jgi:hypothetical protein